MSGYRTTSHSHPDKLAIDAESNTEFMSDRGFVVSVVQCYEFACFLNVIGSMFISTRLFRSVMGAGAELLNLAIEQKIKVVERVRENGGFNHKQGIGP